MRNPVAFIDMDGACGNSTRYLMSLPRPESDIITPSQMVDHIDPACMVRLNRLHAETGCLFVLSSSWRLIHSIEDVERMMRARGFAGSLHSATPTKMSNHARGHEIRWWRRERGHTGPYVVIDDDADAGFRHESHFVHTHRGRVDGVPDDGMADADVDLAIEILRRTK